MTVCVLFILLGIIWLGWKYPNLRKAWFFPPRKGLVVLMYHHVGKVPSPDQFAFTISAADFERQLLFLQENAYTPISVEHLWKVRQTGHSPIKKPVMLTFDDATEDHYTTLFPLLKKYQVPAVIFIITDLVGKPGYMTWEQMLSMQQSGLVEFGSHTCSHRRMRELSQADIIHEITQSKQIIETHLKRPARCFCYPFGAGAFDKQVRPHVLEAGFLLDFSTKRGINAWPWRGKSPLLRAFPRGGESLWDFHLELTRGRSRL